MLVYPAVLHIYSLRGIEKCSCQPRSAAYSRIARIRNVSVCVTECGYARMESCAKDSCRFAYRSDEEMKGSEPEHLRMR